MAINPQNNRINKFRETSTKLMKLQTKKKKARRRKEKCMQAKYIYENDRVTYLTKHKRRQQPN